MSRSLSSLRLLSLTHPRSSISSSEEFYQSLSSTFPSLSSLVEFTLYAPNQANISEDSPEKEDDGTFGHTVQDQQNMHQADKHPYRGPQLPSSFLKVMLSSRGNKLTKLRIFGIAVSSTQLGWICSDCTELRDMAIQLYEGEKVSKTDGLKCSYVCGSLQPARPCKQIGD